MKNFVQRGDTIDVVLAAILASGAPIVVGTRVGVAKVAGVIGDTVAVALEGVFTLAKATGTTPGQGDVLYWDDTAKKVTTSAASGANLKIGYAWAAALTGDTSMNVLLSV